MNLAHWLKRIAAKAPQSPALYRGEELIADYAGFYAQAAGLATSLHTLGMSPGTGSLLLLKTVRNT